MTTKKLPKHRLKEPNRKLTAEQIEAAHLAVQGLTQVTIGGMLNKNKNTITRWFKKPEMKSYLAKIQESAIVATQEYVNMEFRECTQVLVDIVKNGKNESARVQAWRALKELIVPKESSVSHEHIHSFQKWIDDAVPEDWDKDLVNKKGSSSITTKQLPETIIEVDVIMEKEDEWDEEDLS